jgi:hypothetical protein
MRVLRNGAEASIHDCFGPGLVLLTGPDGAVWSQAAEGIGAPLRALRVAADGDVVDEAEEFAAVFGVGRAGAVLVRPDGIVGWRADSPADAPREQLERAVRRLLGR